MYHKVLKKKPKGLYDPAIFVRSNTFAMHLREFSKYLNIISLEELSNIKKSSGMKCVITFDDGWIDNYENAFPILKKYGIPATIFLPAKLVATNHIFWFEKIYILANLAIENGIERKFLDFFKKFNLISEKAYLDQKSLIAIIESMKQFTPPKIEKIIENGFLDLSLKSQLNTNIINWRQAENMGKCGIRFGSHGMGHSILTTLNYEAKSKDIHESKQILKSMIKNYYSEYYSYPNGNWDHESVRLVKEAGYKGAFTTKIGYNHINSNSFLLNRIGLHENISHQPNLLWFRILQALYSGKLA